MVLSYRNSYSAPRVPPKSCKFGGIGLALRKFGNNRPEVDERTSAFLPAPGTGMRLSLGLLLFSAVVGEALRASPGVARGATVFSLTARQASPPRPLPRLKENL